MIVTDRVAIRILEEVIKLLKASPGVSASSDRRQMAAVKVGGGADEREEDDGRKMTPSDDDCVRLNTSGEASVNLSGQFYPGPRAATRRVEARLASCSN